MNEVDVTLQCGGDRIGQRANGLRAGIDVGELREVGRKETIRLADIELYLQPVSRRRQRRGGETVLLQPSIDSVDAVFGRSDKLFNLLCKKLAQ